MAKIHLQRFPNEHYFTLFNPSTGFFVRAEEPGHEEPFWSVHGPEMLDISVTSFCTRECPICYRSAGSNGKHMPLQNYESILSQAAKLGTTQVALGGGNPNEHPEFLEILQITREKYGIVPNYTTNGFGLSDRVLNASAKFCGAVAVSAYEPYSFLSETIRKFRNYEIRTNVHFVLDAQSSETALSWLLDPPDFMKEVNAIIFLNYKPVGRGARGDRLLSHYSKLTELMRVATTGGQNFKVGFDSCMVSGLVENENINPVWYDSCEAARFTMFVSEDMKAYPCSFMESLHTGIPLTNANLLEIWQNGLSFRETRESLKTPKCRGCSLQHVCRGGCPILPKINLCKKRDSSEI